MPAYGAPELIWDDQKHKNSSDHIPGYGAHELTWDDQRHQNSSDHIPGYAVPVPMSSPEMIRHKNNSDHIPGYGAPELTWDGQPQTQQWLFLQAVHLQAQKYSLQTVFQLGHDLQKE